MKKGLWIKGYNKSYKILPDGTIISYVRNAVEGKILKPRNSGTGYLMVTLNGIQVYVHHLVAEHYLINPNKKQFKIVGFKDGNPHNVKISNLFWTDSEGRKKQYLKNKKRELNSKGMFTDKISKEGLLDIARLIKNSTASNKQEIIAKLFGINRITLYRIRKTKEFIKIFESV